MIVVGFEAVAGASILQRWVDGPLWLMALVLTILMTATNMCSVRAYGEFEFWFASIKVVTIIVFLIIGTALRARPVARQGSQLQQPDRARRFRAQGGRRRSSAGSWW